MTTRSMSTATASSAFVGAVPISRSSVRNSVSATHGTSFVCGAPSALSTPRSRAAALPRHATRPVRMTASGNASLAGKKALVIGGTRFSGLYLVHELLACGAEVTLFNRGSKALDDPALMVPGESEADFAARVAKTSLIVGDRTDPESLKSELGPVIGDFDVVFDNNGRELADSKPLIDMLAPSKTHFVYMSSAGVYAKSETMPHVEGDAVDQACRHKGKLNTEDYLRSVGIPFTAIRPTYIYGAGNYNPLEQWFFERIDAGRPVCVPGHGGHLTGLGHVRDLASAMALAAAHPEESAGQTYNVQDRQAVTFDGVANMAAKAMGKPAPEIIHYDPKDFDFGKKKAFPFRPVHFFTSPNKALRELDWQIEYDLLQGFKDAYENDFVHKKAAGKLKDDFETDDMIIGAQK